MKDYSMKAYVRSMKISLGMLWASVSFITFVSVSDIYITIKEKNNPIPTVYRDVNGDGVEDKIVQRKVEKKGFLWTTYDDLENEVFFGVKLNGEKIYLPKDQFEEYKQ